MVTVIQFLVIFCVSYVWAHNWLIKARPLVFDWLVIGFGNPLLSHHAPFMLTTIKDSPFKKQWVPL